MGLLDRFKSQKIKFDDYEKMIKNMKITDLINPRRVNPKFTSLRVHDLFLPWVSESHDQTRFEELKYWYFVVVPTVKASKGEIKPSVPLMAIDVEDIDADTPRDHELKFLDRLRFSPREHESFLRLQTFRRYHRYELVNRKFVSQDRLSYRLLYKQNDQVEIRSSIRFIKKKDRFIAYSTIRLFHAHGIGSPSIKKNVKLQELYRTQTK